MDPKLLLILTLTLTINSAWSQTTFNPFKLQTNNHSSFHGKVAQVSPHSSVEIDNATVSNDNTTLNSSEKDNTLHKNNNELIEPLLDYNGNELPELDMKLSQSKGGNLVKITVFLEQEELGCQNDLKLTLGFDEFTVSSSETNLFLPEGKYFYKLEGSLACQESDNAKVSGQGIIQIKADDQLHLQWQLTDYQNSWMTLNKE